MNKCFLQGNLAADPVMQAVGTSQVVRFTVAVSDSYKKSDGTFSDDVQFIDCEAWDSGAKTIGETFFKGDPVLVEGKLKKDVWEKDGVKQSRQKVRVTNFKRFARYQKAEQVEAQVEDAGVTQPDDEIPF